MMEGGSREIMVVGFVPSLIEVGGRTNDKR